MPGVMERESANARSTLWQLAQDIVLSNDKDGSLNRRLPKLILASVKGLSSGTLKVEICGGTKLSAVIWSLSDMSLHAIHIKQSIPIDETIYKLNLLIVQIQDWILIAEPMLDYYLYECLGFRLS